MSFAADYVSETTAILERVDTAQVDMLAKSLVNSRGRLFILGIGGSAAHASHAVNDFRKLCNVDALCPTDNVAELTARVNDDGWATAYSDWLDVSKLSTNDSLLVLSVGGGTKELSLPLVHAMRLAKERHAPIYGIVGRDGGKTKELANLCVVIPSLYPERVTPHTEGITSVLLHLLVSHPALKKRDGTWEGRR